MRNVRKVKLENLESTIYQLIKEGFDTPGIISEKLGFSCTYITRVMNTMAYKGDILKYERLGNLKNKVYYTTGIYPAHDPFNMTGRAYETYQPSTASH